MKRFKRVFRPSVMGLEKRELLAVAHTYTVMNLLDNEVPGSLRAAVEASNAHPPSTAGDFNVIEFAPGLQNAHPPAPGGFNVIGFDPGLQGVIPLTLGELDLICAVHINTGEGTSATGGLTPTAPANTSIAISGSNRSRIFEIDGGVTAVINGLTFGNGSAASPSFNPGSGGGDGGAIQEDKAGNLTLTGDAFVNNFASNRGGAVFNDYGTLNVTGCAFLNNSTTFHGGAIYNSGIMVADTDLFSSNTAGEGGGAIENANSNLQIPPAVVATITHCIFADNSAVYGGAVSNQNDSIIHLNGDNFLTNHASTYGGAIFNGPGCAADVTGCIFLGNTAGVAGGAIYSIGALTISNSTFLFNSPSPPPRGPILGPPFSPLLY